MDFLVWDVISSSSIDPSNIIVVVEVGYGSLFSLI
jgi:hypothetical protein